MNRVLFVSMALALAPYASGADRFARDPEQTSLATTGRIVKIDLKNNVLRVRVSDGESLSLRSVSQNFAQVIQGLHRLGVTLPGGISIALPGRAKNSAKSNEPKASELEEYTVLVSRETIFQDGGDTIQFDDFRAGEVISIHGVLSGSTLTASRIAKWF